MYTKLHELGEKQECVVVRKNDGEDIVGFVAEINEEEDYFTFVHVLAMSNKKKELKLMETPHGLALTEEIEDDEDVDYATAEKVMRASNIVEIDIPADPHIPGQMWDVLSALKHELFGNSMEPDTDDVRVLGEDEENDGAEKN